MPSIIIQAKELLTKHNIAFKRVYEYAGCTEEHCGPMPRVIVDIEGKIPVCYCIEELTKAIQESKI